MTFSLGFLLVFGLFVAALAVWAVLTVRWALRRDRERRLSHRRATLDE
jgi:hypothetical protein